MWPRRASVPLRHFLLFRVGLMVLVITLITGALLRLLVLPYVENTSYQASQRLALLTAALTDHYLDLASRSLLSIGEGLASHPKAEQTWLQETVRTVSFFETIYVIDREQHLVSIGMANPNLPPVGFLGLDMSRNPVVRQALGKRHSWSEIFLSPVSGRLTVAHVVMVGDRLVVGEIDADQFSRLITRIQEKSGVNAMLLDRYGQIVAHSNPERARQQVNISKGLPDFRSVERSQMQIDGEPFQVVQVTLKGPSWRVIVGRPLKQVWYPVFYMAGMAAVPVAIALLFFFLAWLSIARSLGARFGKFAELAEQVAGGHYSEHWPDSPILEIKLLTNSLARMALAVQQRESDLVDANATLEHRVEERTHELASLNAELSQAMDRLVITQRELVESEKLAALGRVVAGVAHELNTPIGNARVAAGVVAREVETLAADLAEGLRRSRLDAFISAASEAVELMERNLSRAAELIASFKQVAADQTSSQRRPFELNLSLEEIAMSIRPSLKASGCSLQVCSGAWVGEPLHMDSYPGPLGQVLTNLVVNAMLHGYAERAPGEIRIVIARVTPDEVELCVEDDGRGIPREHFERIFEPFFTTRRSRGGTGLGLHLCHQMVTEMLGGQIHAANRPQGGAVFCLTVPRIAPESAGSV